MAGGQSVETVSYRHEKKLHGTVFREKVELKTVYSNTRQQEQPPTASVSSCTA